jgi:RimJ/RimL family protein N-acetyltransferase
MTTLTDLLPVLGLRITAGPLELRGLTDDDLPALCDLALRGIHPEERMPFYVPWTDAPAADLPRNMAQYHWRSRADFSPAAWALHLGVWYDGRLVGTQALDTHDYLVTRTGETGSWLGQEHQGQGIGTAMRQVVCALAFDHLDAHEVTSAAFVDNPASIGVSRKVGYRDNGVRRLRRRDGELAHNLGLVLTPDRFVRYEHPLEVEGLAAFRRSIGLED